MNIEHIAALDRQLGALGFGPTGYALLKRICFRPRHFSLCQQIARGRDRLIIQLFFKADPADRYVLMYYDATLQKEQLISDVSINSIQTGLLEKQMAAIDWQQAFDLTEQKPWSADNGPSWERERQIEQILDELETLAATEEGLHWSLALKHKYWSATSCRELIGTLPPLKSKAVISQRFYCFESEPVIGVDEAHRFLQNKWRERQLQAQRKTIAPTNDTGGSADQPVKGVKKKTATAKGVATK